MTATDRPAALDIGPLASGDLDELYLIEEASFSAPWNLRSFYDQLAGDERFRIQVAREAADVRPGPVVGYAAYFDLGEEYHLIALAVRIDRRRRGVGRSLLDRIKKLADEDRVRRITLEVRASNPEAAAFYEGGGFIPVAIRTAYYEDTGEDALVMWRAT